MKTLPLTILIGLLVLSAARPAVAWEPLRAHPGNPYVLEFREQPTVLRTFAQHYSSVINSEFDFVPYLDVLERDGMNLTRVFLLGFRLDQDDTANSPLAPPPAQFLQPWRRSSVQGTALDGLGKWDFSEWNENYFARLNAFAQACSDRNIAIELTLFCVFYDDRQWEASPFNPTNNVQGVGPASRHDSMRPVNSELLAVQEAVVRRIVNEVNRFDNIYFEIQNEPFWNQPGVKDDQEVEFHNQMLAIIRSEESGLPNRHLVAHNFPQQADALSEDFDVINEHYPAAVPDSTIAGAEALLRDHYSRGRILALDETATAEVPQARLESWMFFLGGGGIYNGLDFAHFIYSVDDESGDNPFGRGIRGAVRNAGSYLENLHFIDLRRDLTWITGGIPEEAALQAMANPGQQYVAYLHHGQSGNASFQTVYHPIDESDHAASPVVMLDEGTWRAVWTRPSDLAVLHIEEFTHGGGEYTLAEITYQEDVALRIDRTGEGDATPPPRPTALAAAAHADGSIALSWNPVQAADLAFYHVYRSGSSGVPLDVDHQIAVLPATDTTFSDTSAVVDATYHYVVTAVDLTGNESAASRENRATSIRTSEPAGGVAWLLPGMIQAEDFDVGGQGVAYNDLTPENDAGQYRESESVDIEVTTDEGGGHHVSGTEAGEWLKYTVFVTEAGGFILELRSANSAAGGEVYLEVDGTDVSGIIAIPETGGFGTWQTVAVPDIQLSAGIHVLRLVMATAAPGGIAGAINWISFTAVPRIGPTANAGPDVEVVDQDGDGFAEVTLDASASVAGDAPITSFVWSHGGAPLASGINPSLNLGVGGHVIQLVVTDGNGLQDSDEIAVTVSVRDLMNGSFESGYEGWGASGNQSIKSSLPSALPYPATDGVQLVALNDSERAPNGVLAQTFATVPGQAYLLSFDMGVLAFNTLEQRLQVDVAGSLTLVSQTFPIFGLGGGNTRWLAKSLPFTADCMAMTLTFRDRSAVSSGLDLLLDHVRITPRIVRTLVVESSPTAGGNVMVSPPDDNSQANGTTHFSRRYANATVVNLSAAPAAGAFRFQKWLKNGADLSSSRAISVTMDGDHALTAIYVEGAPVITAQPLAVTTGLGGNATFRVAAEGSGTLTYQWRFNGADIIGAETDTYTIDSAQAEHAGNYDVVVSSAAGSVTSEPAALTVVTTFLVNGSFESDFQGWTVSGNQSIRSAAPYAATDGSKLVAFNHSNLPPNAVLSQSFATAAGQTYTLAFDAGVLSYNTKSQTVLVTVTGSGTLLSRTITVIGAGGGTNRWLPQSFTFVANSTVAVLTFLDQSTSTDALDLLLDNVRITEATSEPNTAPVAAADAYSTVRDSPLVVPAPGVLTNDTDAQANPLTAALDAGPGHGSVTLNAGGGFTYIPAANYTGADSFTYHANDGSLNSNVATVNLSVNAVASQLLVNGSFELNYLGWSSSGNQGIYSWLPYVATDGSKLVAFNIGNLPPNAVLSQTFATVAGQTYQLTFDAGVLSYNTKSQTMQVTVTGAGSLLTRTITVIGGGGTNRWLPQSFAFVADSASATLAFRDQSSSTDSLDLLLDNVRVTNQAAPAPAAVPQAALGLASLPDDVLPAAPSITRVEGGFRIALGATGPGLYELQRSPDLHRWEPLAERFLSETGVLEFTDPGPPAKRMFYRIALRRSDGIK